MNRCMYFASSSSVGSSISKALRVSEHDPAKLEANFDLLLISTCSDEEDPQSEACLVPTDTQEFLHLDQNFRTFFHFMSIQI